MMPLNRRTPNQGAFMNTQFRILMLLLVPLWLLQASETFAEEKLEHTKDSLETVKKNLQERKAVLLDVREKTEWDAGHLEQAVLAPLSKLKEGSDPKTLVKDLDKKTIIYCHCRAGRRALTAGEILKNLGYEVRPLKQGYDELVKEGFAKSK
jgi:rhodanese-related sulfurtransferase